MTYKAIRKLAFYSEAFSLKVQVYNTDGTSEILTLDESEEPVVTELINRLDGTVKAEGGALEFVSATFDTVSPDPWLVQWVNWATEAQERI